MKLCSRQTAKYTVYRAPVPRLGTLQYLHIHSERALKLYSGKPEYSPFRLGCVHNARVTARLCLGDGKSTFTSSASLADGTTPGSGGGFSLGSPVSDSGLLALHSS